MVDEILDNLHKKMRQEQVKGFLEDDEAECLWRWAREAGTLGPLLEIGSYCGKSSVYLASGCSSVDAVVYAVDHHRGSEEHQLGEEYHDPDLYDKAQQSMDSFPQFRKNIAAFELSDSVIPVVSTSQILVRHWQTPLSLVFVDGGHSPEVSMHDCCQWSRKLLVGGILAVHDVFANPEEGGQGPFFGVQAVLKEGEFEMVEQVRSLLILRRVRDAKK